jgi:23S rRNA (pseudouridine1915-N3)-methyltransferase
MLNVTVICVGKMKEKFYIEAAAEYQKRLKGYCKLNLVELPEEKLPQAPTLGQIEAALEKEQESIMQKLPKSGRVVAMCVEGVPMSSPELSQTLGGWMVAGASDVTFVVGGSYGLSPRVKKRADLRLSMSEMTFPHHLARVMLLEQIYRAFKIQEGSGYHK